MKIRFLRSMVAYGSDHRIGEVLEVEPTQETRYVIANGWAEVVTDSNHGELEKRVVRGRKKRVVSDGK